MRDFETIYKTYFRDVYLYLLRLTGGDRHLSEDLTSDTFFRALRGIESFRGTCDLRVWLCQIAKNCCRTHWKRSRRAQPLPEIDPLSPATDPSPEVQILHRETLQEIQTALSALPEPYRTVFLRRSLEGMPFKEIAARSQMTANWACVTYHRARAMIRERMEEQTHGT